MNEALRSMLGRMIGLSTVLVLFGVIILSCKSPSEPDHAPVISNLRYSPQSAWLGEGGGRVTVTGTINFVDDGGDLATLRVTVPGGVDLSTPVTGAAGLKGGALQGVLSVSTATVGSATFQIWVVDQKGNSSNKLSGVFEVKTDDTGSRWTTGPVLTTAQLNKVIWAGSRFVVVGYGGVIFTSLDAATWTPRTSNTSDVLWDVVWAGTQIVAVGENGRILTSPDGITWTSRRSGLPLRPLHGVTWSGSKFVAVGAELSATNAEILTSSDGVQWDNIPSPVSNATLTAVTWAGDKFVAVGNEAASPNANVILTSTDGITWSRRNVGSSYGLFDVIWNGSKILTGGNDISLVSSDGQNWASAAVTSRINGLAWSGTRFLAVGNSVLSSTDGLVWTYNAGPAGLQSVVWHNQQYVAVGWAGGVFTSP